MEQTPLELTTYAGAPAAALYWRSGEGYERIAGHGDHSSPRWMDPDDRATVALRAERRAPSAERRAPSAATLTLKTEDFIKCC
jgi:hypothetical protein